MRACTWKRDSASWDEAQFSSSDQTRAGIISNVRYLCVASAPPAGTHPNTECHPERLEWRSPHNTG